MNAETVVKSNNFYIDKDISDAKIIRQSELKDINAFHLFSHGKPGALLIDGKWLENKSLLKYLTPLVENKNELNIYACNFAKGEKGKDALLYLKENLQIHIAASSNITGVDGDWILEEGVTSSSISLPNYKNNLQIGVCNEKIPLVNGATFSGLSADSKINGLICLGSIYGENNLIDSDLNNYGTVNPLVGLLGCTYTFSVVDNNSVYNAGSYAGFEIDASSLLTVGVATTITISTYLNGNQRESYPLTSSLIGLNTSLLNSNGTTTAGFQTSYDFDEIRISYYSLVDVSLGSNLVYYPVIQEFCAPSTPVACNELTPITNPEYPVFFNSERTGINSGVACVGCAIDSVENILDADTSKYASANVTVGIAANASVSVKNALSTTPANTFVGFEIENTSVINLSLLDNITITTYKNNSVQETMSGQASLLDVGTDILASNSRRNIGFVTTKDFDEVQITFVNTVGVSLGETRIYSYYQQ